MSFALRTRTLLLPAALAFVSFGFVLIRVRVRVRVEYTNPNDTKANAGRKGRGVRVRSENDMCENQGAWAAKCLTKREALVGGVHSRNAHRKAPDLRDTLGPPRP